jgi:hypothetical protein
MKHYDHIIRFAILLIFVGIGFFAVRGFVVPDSFGIYGTYSKGYHRGDSDEEQAAIAALYQDSGKCAKCHEEQSGLWKEAGHGTVACETCHGNWQAHNNNTKDQVEKDSSVDACLLCHQQLEARPDSFPQIVEFKQHLAEQEQEFEKDMTCTDCHDPHEPM